jgi:hypothetical protein
MPKPTDKHSAALEKDNRFALLLNLLFLRPIDVEEGTEGAKEWIVPASHRPYMLEERKEDMEFYLSHPYVVENGKSAGSLLKKKKVKVAKKRVKRIDDDGEETERKPRAKKVEGPDDFKSAEVEL